MQYFLILFLLFALLLDPLPTLGRVWENADGTTISVERPSRRILRTMPRMSGTGNLDRLTIREVSLDRTFDAPEFGVKIQYPSSWERLDLLQRTDPLTLVAMFLSREERPRGIRQNVNLVVEDLPAEMTLADYTELGIRMEEDYFDRYALLDSEDILLAGVYRAHRVVFAATSDVGEMLFEQIWMLKGKQAYVWTFADSAEGFDDHVMVFEKMMDTVTVQ